MSKIVMHLRSLNASVAKFGAVKAVLCWQT